MILQIVVGAAAAAILTVPAAFADESKDRTSNTVSNSNHASDVMVLIQELRADVALLKDREEVHQVYIHYGRGIDRLDEELYRSAFWPDAQINYGTKETLTVDAHWKGHMINWHKGKLAAWGHLLTNEAVEIRGDVAHVETYVTPMWVPKEKGENWMLISGRYIDRLDRRNGEWRISVREFIPHFAMKIDTTPFDMINSEYEDAKSECAKAPWGRRDTSYVRPLSRRKNMEDGPPCAQ